MASFDPIEGEKRCAELPLTELVRIAYLDDDYLPEAREIALRELDKREVPQGRDELISQVRRQLEKLENARDEARSVADRVTRERMDRFQARIVVALLVLALWCVAFFAPLNYDRERYEFGGVDVALLAGWVFLVLVAIWKYRQGKPLWIYAVLVVPAGLFVLGLALRARGQ